MADDWYYAQGGQQKGPVSGDALRQLLAAGQVSSGDLVWRDGMANWQPAGQVPEFASAPAAPVQPGTYAAPQAGVGQPTYGQPPYGQPGGAGQPLGYGGYAPAQPAGVTYAKDAQTA